MSQPPPSPAPAAAPLLTLLHLEKEVRQAESEAAFGFVAVNRCRALVRYRQAVLLRRAPGPSGAWRVEAVSDVAVLDRDAPFLHWLRRIAPDLAQPDSEAPTAPRTVTAATVREAERGAWMEFCAPHGLWVPLHHPAGTALGALLLLRDTPFDPSEALLAERLAETCAHAWKALAPQHWQRRLSPRRRSLVWGSVLAVVVAGLAVPVPQSALAPGQVVAHAPEVVSAPLEGVIDRFHIAPNQTIEAGTPLFSFEDTELRNALAVATEELAVAEAELRTATQGAFRDAEGRAQLTLLRARVDLRRAERDHAAERLSRVTVTAERGGLAVFHDVSDWIGRPVSTGQKVLEIADPAQVALRLHLAVGDAIALDPGAPVRLFLDVDPLRSLPAVLVHAAYEPDLSDDQILGYRILAHLEDGVAPPRIGLKGIARIEGPSAPLALHLFRRPLAAVRQFLGV